MRMKKSLLILLFTCWALFFAAFRPVMPFAAETAAFPDGTPVTGGRILMGTIGEPSNLIPYMASDSPGSCMWLRSSTTRI